MSRIVVLGGAESGVGAAVLAKVKGHEVFLSDKGKIKDEYVETLKKWDIPYEEGHHTEELILNADEVVKSPGIPGTVPMVQKLRAQGTHIVSEIEFASRYDSAKKICITGSNGKTTTTSLIYYLLQNAGLNVGLGGNIGKSYAYQVATEHFDYYVLEISSFQLDDVYDFKPDIAIITNITPDHLDRYDHKMENYVAAKFNITKNLTRDDCFIFDSDDDITIGHLDNIILRCKMLPFSQEKEVEQGAFLRDDHRGDLPLDISRGHRLVRRQAGDTAGQDQPCRQKSSPLLQHIISPPFRTVPLFPSLFYMQKRFFVNSQTLDGL